jgi:hypothetical protein
MVTVLTMFSKSTNVQPSYRKQQQSQLSIYQTGVCNRTYPSEIPAVPCNARHAVSAANGIALAACNITKTLAACKEHFNKHVTLAKSLKTKTSVIKLRKRIFFSPILNVREDTNSFLKLSDVRP